MKIIGNMLRFLAYLPFLYLIVTVSNMLYLSGQAIFSNQHLNPKILHIITIILSSFILWQYRDFFDIKTNAKKTKLGLFLLFFSVFLIRSPLYFPTHDDLSSHIPAAFYGQSQFNLDIFGGVVNYKYPALDLNNYWWLSTAGIRVTLLALGVLISIWFVSLDYRLKLLLPPQKRWLITLMILLLFFFPLIISTQASFMTDVPNTLICLEAFCGLLILRYRLTSKSAYLSFSLILVVVAALVKQSNITFFPFWILLALYPFVVMRQKAYSIKQVIPILWPALIILIGSGFYFIRVHNETNLYLDHFRRQIQENSFGPTNLMEIFVWPFWGQLTKRYTDIYISWYSNWFFTIIIMLMYGYLHTSLFSYCYRKIFGKKKLVIFPLVPFFLIISYLFWALFSGYSRYAMPLYGILFLNTVFMLPNRLLTTFSFLTRYKRINQLAWLLVIIFCYSSIKSDYAWRPYPSLKNKESTRYFAKKYYEGWQLFFKDSPNSLAELYKPIFDQVDAVTATSYGQEDLIVFLAGLLNKPTLTSFSTEEVEMYQDKNQLYPKLLDTLQKLKWIQTTLVVSERKNESEIPKLYLSPFFNCKPIVNNIESIPLESASLNELALYICTRRS